MVRDVLPQDARMTLKRRMALLVVAALCAAMLPMGAGPALAAAGDRWTLAASDAVTAAIAVSRHAFPSGAPSALLARADTFPDSLASGVLQREGPLLLTDSTELSDETATELARLGTRRITILGGTNAVSSTVANALNELGISVTRIAGSTRVDTAVAIASTRPVTPTVLLARAFGGSDPTQGFADALAAGAWSARAGMPILLSETEQLSASTKAYLASRLPVTVVMIGGTAALSSTVEKDLLALGAGVRRVAGTERAATATAIAAAQGFANSNDVSRVVLVDGRGDSAWAAGFASAALAAQQSTAVLLAETDALPTPTRRFLLSGETELICAPLLATARCNDGAQRLSLAGVRVGPFLDTSTADQELAAGQRREYRVQVSGGGPITLALVAPHRAGTDSGGWVLDDDGDGKADAVGAPDARITQVNGMSVPPAAVVNGVVPVSGRVTFHVDQGAAGTAVRAVAFADLDGNAALAVDGLGTPREAAAVSGATVWAGPHVADGAYAEQVVDQAWAAFKLFTVGSKTFRWKATDSFAYNSGLAAVTTLSLAQFEAMVSVGDTVAATMAASGSRFTIVRDIPAAPTGLTATPVDLNGDLAPDTVRVRWNRPANIDIARDRAYVIQGSTLAESTGTDAPASALWADWVQVAQSTAPGVTTVDVVLPAGTHRLRALARNGAGDVSVPIRPVLVTVNPVPPLAALESTLVAFTSGSGQASDNKVLDAGDRFAITFDSAVTAAADASISIRDVDGTFVKLTRGSNAAFTVSGEKNEILTVAVTAPPTRLDAAGDAHTNIATLAVIEAATGISNSSGVWNLPASGRADVSPRNRTVVGGNTKLPTAIAAASLRTDVGAKTVTILAAAAGIATGDPFDVFDRTGARVGGATYAATTGTTVTLAAMAEGERYYVVYRDVDKASVSSATATVVVGSTKPVLSKVTGTSTSVVLAFNEAVTLLGGTGHLQVYDRDDRLLFSSVSAVTGGNKFVIATLPTALVSGTNYHLRVEAGLVRDATSATNDARVMAFTASAGAVPTVTVATGPAGNSTVITAASTWTGTAADTSGVVTTVERRVDGGAWLTLGVSAATPDESLTWTLALTLSDGSHTVDVRATDNNGGFSTVLSRTIVVNAEVPSLISASFANSSTLAVAFSEPVTCPTSGSAAWSFDDGGGAITATSVAQTGAPSTQCSVVFAGTPFAANPPGTLFYAQPGTASQRVIDAANTVLATSNVVVP